MSDDIEALKAQIATLTSERDGFKAELGRVRTGKREAEAQVATFSAQVKSASSTSGRTVAGAFCFATARVLAAFTPPILPRATAAAAPML